MEEIAKGATKNKDCGFSARKKPQRQPSCYLDLMVSVNELLLGLVSVLWKVADQVVELWQLA